ncbi:MAG: hypothetical protein INH41_12375 [Myxococcaceae bacterium]|jgi:predicted hotdog family 3-hydroxylacyl-ACP dehydratase|nr:hypothetical protein [Myxococcaceae bacterium]
MTPAFPPISELVPHQGPMVLLDRVLAESRDGLTAEAIVRAGRPFVRDAGWPALVGLELMAQTMAAWSGLRARRAGRAPRLGFLAGTRHFDCLVPFFPPDARLEVEIALEFDASNGLAVFDCVIRTQGVVQATAKVNSYEPDDVSAFLERSS